MQVKNLSINVTRNRFNGGREAVNRGHVDFAPGPSVSGGSSKVSGHREEGLTHQVDLPQHVGGRDPNALVEGRVLAGRAEVVVDGVGCGGASPLRPVVPECVVPQGGIRRWGLDGMLGGVE